MNRGGLFFSAFIPDAQKTLLPPPLDFGTMSPFVVNQTALGVLLFETEFLNRAFFCLGNSPISLTIASLW